MQRKRKKLDFALYEQLALQIQTAVTNSRVFMIVRYLILNELSEQGTLFDFISEYGLDAGGRHLIWCKIML